MGYIRLYCTLVYVYADFTTYEHPFYTEVPEGTTEYDPDLDDKMKCVSTDTPFPDGWHESHNSRRLINSWFRMSNGVRISDYDPKYVDPEDARCG